MKIAIIGAAYTGLEAARYLKSKGHTISVTTTKEARVPELEAVADRVVVMTGSDRDESPVAPTPDWCSILKSRRIRRNIKKPQSWKTPLSRPSNR